MAWPGTPGGAASPAWGDNVRLYVWAAIAAGSTMHWGVHALDRLDAGNVWSSGGPPSGPTPPAGTMWVDVSCDVVDLEVHIGADRTSPPPNVADAGTVSIVLADPTRKYDPLNPDGPYQYGGHSRLGADTPIRVFAETLATPSTVTQWPLFVGTVDTWTEDWTPYPKRRRAHVVASDAVKILARRDWGPQTAVGAADYQFGRIGRILDYYGWTGPRVLDNPIIQYAATTLDGSAWALLSAVVADGNGFLFIDGNGAVSTAGSNRWAVRYPTLVLQVGCGPDPPPAGAVDTTVYEVVLDVDVDTSSTVVNSVTAGRAGGPVTRYANATSIGLYGEQGIRSTDLGLYTDTDVANYAASILGTRAFPRGRVESVTIRPSLNPACWPTVFRNQSYLAKEHMRVYWAPPDGGTAYDVRGRPFGVTHRVGRDAWDVTYALGYADVYARVMHWGTHALDRLDAGNVYV